MLARQEEVVDQVEVVTVVVAEVVTVVVADTQVDIQEEEPQELPQLQELSDDPMVPHSLVLELTTITHMVDMF